MRLIAAWVLGLAVVAGTGLVGRAISPGRGADASAAPVPAASAVPVPSRAGLTSLVLLRPALAAEFRAGRIRVAGYRSGHGPVRLTVIDERGRILEAVRLMPRPRSTSGSDLRVFAGTLTVPNPPRGGTIWVEVVAYDPDGGAVAALTRSLRVLVPAEATSGDD